MSSLYFYTLNMKAGALQVCGCVRASDVFSRSFAVRIASAWPYLASCPCHAQRPRRSAIRFLLL